MLPEPAGKGVRVDEDTDCFICCRCVCRGSVLSHSREEPSSANCGSPWSAGNGGRRATWQLDSNQKVNAARSASFCIVGKHWNNQSNGKITRAACEQRYGTAGIAATREYRSAGAGPCRGRSWPPCAGHGNDRLSRNLSCIAEGPLQRMDGDGVYADRRCIG